MSWGTYYMFYICPQCQKKYRWSLDDMNDAKFSECPACHIPGDLTGETKDIKQGENKFSDYEYI
ncbi:MAG: hypothetical protein ACRDBO_20155 [Lachnospiraceae bacterium]